jgi:hypothetical protein
MNGNWTDWSVYDTGADDPRNWNVPGDGKFDQSAISGNVDLMVGRVDMANLPGQHVANGSPTFPDETTLLRQYLNKDHNFRTKAFDLPRRGIIFDGFGDYGGYAFSASGWRNFAPFFGSSIVNVTQAGAWLPTLGANGYLWAYACGPGSYNGMNGPGHTGSFHEMTTTDLVGADIKAVFTMLFGSWFGDWDSTDDLARASLASPTYTLVCCWSGSPHWFCQQMGLGATIGSSTRLTQNNGPNGLYRTQTNSYAGLVHIALLGDPSLRMHVVAPSPFVMGFTNGNGVQLFWSESPDDVLGYYVYRATNGVGPFTRITTSVDTDTFFTDTNAAGGTFTYMVRALKLESTPSGTYTNASEGIFVTVTVAAAPSPPTPVPVSAIFFTPTGLVLSWSSQIGRTYDVLYKANIADPGWFDFHLNLSSPAATLSWTDETSSAVAQRFYRVMRTGGP